MSIRNDILDNLKTALEAVTGVAYVGRGELPDPANRTYFPALYIQDDGGYRKTRNCADSKIQKMMEVSIVGFYRAATDLSKRFNDFLQDVENAIEGADLGSYCRDSTVDSTNPIITLDGQREVQFVVNVQIKYWRTLA